MVLAWAPRAQSRPGRRGTTMVRAPGQNDLGQSSGRRRTAPAGPASASACSNDPTSTGRSSDSGRAFSANRASVAPRRVGSTASPYTVSVGTATTAPARSAATASSSPTGSITGPATGPPARAGARRGRLAPRCLVSERVARSRAVAACDGATSTTRLPPGASHRGASIRSASMASKPVGPGTSAATGSWSRTTGSSDVHSDSETYGGLATTNRTCPGELRRKGDRTTNPRPRRTPAADARTAPRQGGEILPAHLEGVGETRRSPTRRTGPAAADPGAAWHSTANDSAIAPEPGPEVARRRPASSWADAGPVLGGELVERHLDDLLRSRAGG